MAHQKEKPLNADKIKLLAVFLYPKFVFTKLPKKAEKHPKKHKNVL
jgi:hypothetical protein